MSGTFIWRNPQSWLWPIKAWINSLETYICYDANFVVTGDTGGCRYDNPRCYQRRQSMLSGFNVIHQMETFSALLAICAGNSPVPGEFPAQRPVTRSFDVFFDLRLNKQLGKQPWCWGFETLSRPLWRHRYVLFLFHHPSAYIVYIQRDQHTTVETLYSTIYYSKYFIELNFDKSTQYVAFWTQKRHPIPRPFGRAMECLLWVLQQKLTVL